MKNKLLLIIISFIILLLIIGGIFILSFGETDELELYIDNDINKYIYNIDKNNYDVFSLEYQELVEKKINKLEKQNDYSFNNPLLILNPYGTNLTGIYIYFETENNRVLEYTISVEDEMISDYTNILVGDLTKIHKGYVIGLVQGVKNTITFRLLDESLEQVAIRKITVNMPLYNQDSMLKIGIKDKKNIIGGLFYVPYQKDTSYLSLYDNNGILRMELYGDGDSSSQVIKYNDNGDLLYLKNDKYIHMNKYGRIINYYNNTDDVSNFVNDNKLNFTCLVKNKAVECLKYTFKNIFFGTLMEYSNDGKDKNETTNNIQISKNKLYKYNSSTNTLLGINGLSNVDFIYYDSIYFDIYDYNKEELIIPSEIDSVKIKKITGFNLSNVKSIKIENGVEEIMDYCFVGAKQLEKLYVPKSVKKIGNRIFGDRKVEIIYY